MKLNRIKLLIAFMISVNFMNAQQDAQLSMYMFNMLQYNAGYAGSKEDPYASAIFRTQWVGLKGAPQTLSLNFHSPLKRKQYALGASVRGDKLGATTYANTDAYFAYRLKLDKDTKLSLGVSVGFMYYQLNMAEPIINSQKDALLNNNPNKVLPNFGFGAYAYNPKYYVGVSVPHILTSSLREAVNGANTLDTLLSSQATHVFGTAGVILGKSDMVKFKPSVMVKYVPKTPLSLDLNMSVLLQERYWIGASYRFGGDIYELNTGNGQFGKGNAIIGIVKFLATREIEIGYAYEYPLSQLNLGTSASHEIMLGYTFKGKNLRYVTPRYGSYF